jgi:hypothetical protein
MKEIILDQGCDTYRRGGFWKEEAKHFIRSGFGLNYGYDFCIVNEGIEVFIGSNKKIGRGAKI